jgi:hypothetical protein
LIPAVARQRSAVVRLCALLLTIAAAACENSSTPSVAIGNGTEESGLSLKVSANPNNVLSAVALVTPEPGVVSVHVTYEDPSGTVQSTPELAVGTFAGVPSPVVVPILGLRAETRYVLQAASKTAAGATSRSPTVTFTTGPLPSGVVPFKVAAGGQASAGYTLLDRLPPMSSTAVDYLTIVDGQGTPVWYLGLPGNLVGDAKRNWDGTFTAAIADTAHAIPGLVPGPATFEQYDVLGNHIRTWTSPGSLATDGHEFLLQPNGDAVFFGLNERTMDLTAYGGHADATVVGNVLQRVTPDGQVTFSWDVFDHLSIAQMDPLVSRTDALVDFTHANAIDVTPDSNYLASMRHLSQVILIDSQTGDIVWKLGGKDGDFQFVNDPLNGFSLQHGAQLLADNHVLLFDNGNGHSPQQSRGVEYVLDFGAKTATLVWSSEDTPPFFSQAMGYVQRIDNGNTLICYAIPSHVQEVDANGQVLWDLSDPHPEVGIYRAYRIDSLY